MAFEISMPAILIIYPIIQCLRKFAFNFGITNSLSPLKNDSSMKSISRLAYISEASDHTSLSS